jgi:hypothetical protein
MPSLQNFGKPRLQVHNMLYQVISMIYSKVLIKKGEINSIFNMYFGALLLYYLAFGINHSTSPPLPIKNCH